MAVSIQDNRTLIDHADSLTGWSSPTAGETLTLFSTDPSPVEATDSIGMAVSTQTSDIIHTHGSNIDGSGAGTLVYVWVLPLGTMDTTTNGGTQIVIGDGTDTVGYNIAGSDVSGFRHETGPVGWQCLVLDTANLPAGTTVVKGVLGNLTLSTLTEFGAQYKTLSKALGGASNCFTDTIRVGTGGITTAGGTSGDRGTFAEITATDRSTTTGTAYGILRELGIGLYGCQGFMLFGDGAGVTAHYFEDTNFVVNWEDRGLASGRYGMTIQANATGVGSFILGAINGTENGQNGGSLIMPTASGASFDATDADHDEIKLYDTTFKNWTGTLDFSDDATLGVDHDAFDCTFDTCGAVNPGRIDIKNCNFVNSTVATGASGGGALHLLDTDNTLLKGLSFTKGSNSGHAIHLDTTGSGPFTFTFTNFTYSGYGATDSNTASVLVDNNLDTDITINVTGGDTPTIQKATGYTGTVSVVASVDMDITVKDPDGNNIQDAQVYIQDSGGTQLMNEQTNASGFATEAYGGTTPENVIVRIRKSSLGTRYKNFSKTDTVSGTGLTLNVTMQLEPNASAGFGAGDDLLNEQFQTNPSWTSFGTEGGAWSSTLFNLVTASTGADDGAYKLFTAQSEVWIQWDTKIDSVSGFDSGESIGGSGLFKTNEAGHRVYFGFQNDAGTLKVSTRYYEDASNTQTHHPTSTIQYQVGYTYNVIVHWKAGTGADGVVEMWATNPANNQYVKLIDENTLDMDTLANCDVALGGGTNSSTTITYTIHNDNYKVGTTGVAPSV